MAEGSPNHANFEEEFECAICCEEYKDPRALPCLHTFCLGCLEQLSAGSPIIILCPHCRLPCPITKGVSSLPKNFILSNLIAKRNAPPSSSPPEKPPDGYQLRGGAVLLISLVASVPIIYTLFFSSKPSKPSWVVENLIRF
mmetsp:Transcript_22154/g.30442  ORF Transcript_22154/g.30442 Transcript_22154/m.30442 type:complete len:141 (+) Transcript_22154:226-648(+)